MVGCSGSFKSRIIYDVFRLGKKAKNSKFLLVIIPSYGPERMTVSILFRNKMIAGDKITRWEFVILRLRQDKVQVRARRLQNDVQLCDRGREKRK